MGIVSNKNFPKLNEVGHRIPDNFLPFPGLKLLIDHYIFANIFVVNNLPTKVDYQFLILDQSSGLKLNKPVAFWAIGLT